MLYIRKRAALSKQLPSPQDCLETAGRAFANFRAVLYFLCFDFVSQEKSQQHQVASSLTSQHQNNCFPTGAYQFQQLVMAEKMVTSYLSFLYHSLFISPPRGLSNGLHSATHGDNLILDSGCASVVQVLPWGRTPSQWKQILLLCRGTLWKDIGEGSCTKNTPKMYLCGNTLHNFQRSNGTVLNCCYSLWNNLQNKKKKREPEKQGKRGKGNCPRRLQLNYVNFWLPGIYSA